MKSNRLISIFSIDDILLQENELIEITGGQNAADGFCGTGCGMNCGASCGDGCVGACPQQPQQTQQT